MDKKIELLIRIAHEFNKTNISWALGASMLLYFKGIIDEFNDIDLMIIEEDVDIAYKILSKMSKIKPVEPNPKYQTKIFMKFEIDMINVDVMAGFMIVNGNKVYDCSLKKEQIVEKIFLGNEVIPLQSINLWKKYYHLMDRKDKVKMIEDTYIDE